jgi:hypothetical protein
VIAVPATPAAAPPTRIQVVEREFSLQLSRQVVAPGWAIVEVVDFGEDVHDLRVQRVGERHVAGTRRLEAGQRVRLRLKLKRGRYRIWCSVGDHAHRGMTATLYVRASRVRGSRTA